MPCCTTSRLPTSAMTNPNSAETRRVGACTGLDGAALATASRLVAKIDSAEVQDGYDLRECSPRPPKT